MNPANGTVYLVGAGPGDPGLITVRGLELLRRAEVVVHDRLVAAELLTEASPQAEIIDVGKAPGRHRYSQRWINAILVDRAGRGRVVVRLKGGDPFVFGRGFEELTACRDMNVDCVVVPGVTSAIAAPAAAGIPLTHRGQARSLAIVSARGAQDGSERPLDYKALAAIDVVVILMGCGNLKEVTQTLMDAGREGLTPAACVEQATTARQRTVVATLATLADAADKGGLRAPLVTVIGEVAEWAGSAGSVYGPTCLDAPAALPQAL